MKKIVIVEDDALFLDHLSRLFRAAGYDVHGAQHASQALALIDTVSPDAIVLDMLLAGSTAMPLLHELASHVDLADIPIVMLTSLAADLDLTSLQLYGVREVLDKTTVQPDDIELAVRKVLV